MSKGIYLGSASIAKKIKKIYIGDTNGLARKAKKMYIGDANDVARNCLSGGTPAYYGTAPNLSIRRSRIRATSAEGYALFAGGRDGTTSATSYVEYYTPYLAKGVAASLFSARYHMGATNLGNLVFFGGGTKDISSSASSACFTTVDVYNLPSFTHTQPQGLSNKSWGLGAGAVGNYAVFVGGACVTSYYANYYAYDTSLTRLGTGTERVTAQHGNSVGCTTIGNYLLAGGGYAGQYVDVVDVIDSSLTVGTPKSLNVRMAQPLVETVGNRAMFINQGSTEVDMFSASLTRTTFSVSNAFPNNGASAALDDYVLIGGGGSGSSYESQMLTITASGTLRSLTKLSEARRHVAATVVGEFAIFAGGEVPSAYSWTADAYHLV